ncbi:MAG: hypothetical protein Q8P22_01700 [Chloroflexota bacterium]|nr:hypothetical protein [Chloroflexota bacterium]
MQDAYVVRFDAHQRVQHILMIGSFLVLALTGLPQKFPALEVCQWLMDAMGGIQTVRFIHRIAAGVMIFDGIYHISYVAYTVLVLRRTGPLRMIPSLKDVRDAVQMTQYFLGLSVQKPKFGRFSYLEKFDYWAVFWGMAIMGGSGLILLFPTAVTRVLPGQLVIAALRAHSDEALLAVTWIFVVHLFYAHLTPRIFPFNPAIFTGRIPAPRYQEEHPLEYEELLAAGLIAVPQPMAASRPGPRPAVALVRSEGEVGLPLSDEDADPPSDSEEGSRSEGDGSSAASAGATAGSADGAHSEESCPESPAADARQAEPRQKRRGEAA